MLVEGQADHTILLQLEEGGQLPDQRATHQIGVA